MFISSSGTPIRNGQKIKWSSDFILFPSEVAVIKIEAHTKKIEPHYQSVAITDFHAKAAATESKKILAHVDAVQSPSAKNYSLLPYFCHSGLLVTAAVCSWIRETNMSKQ